MEKVKETELMKLLVNMHIYKAMLSNRLKCKKSAENQTQRTSKNSKNKTMLLSKCAICGTEKPRFIKKQKASEIFSSSGLKTLLSKILLFGDILFWTQLH